MSSVLSSFFSPLAFEYVKQFTLENWDLAFLGSLRSLHGWVFQTLLWNWDFKKIYKSIWTNLGATEVAVSTHSGGVVRRRQLSESQKCKTPDITPSANQTAECRYNLSPKKKAKRAQPSLSYHWHHLCPVSTHGDNWRADLGAWLSHQWDTPA